MVVLREITKENYEECLNLNIADSQKILFPQRRIRWHRHEFIIIQRFPLLSMQMM